MSEAANPETEHALEQTYIDAAYVALDVMAERAAEVLDAAARDAHLTDAVDAAAIQDTLARRVASFAPSNAPLTFGRIDEGTDRFYIGRRHVADAGGEPLVVDWRAGVSAPFYRATWADPLGLDRRRRFALDGRQLVGYFDEDFTDPDSEGGSGGVPDPLLAELDRARTGAMRDIVSTIQAEQDEIIRASIDELLIVQGGPGTGKTAVGLHRAAFLMFGHRERFERHKLLVVGPNRLFLAYIRDVLPSLGETSIVQATIETLNSRAFPVRGTEAADVARVKGDGRMPELLRRLITAKISSPDSIAAAGPFECMTAFGGVSVASSEVASVLDEVTSRSLPANSAREVFREQVISLLWRARSQRVDVSPEQQFAFTADLRSQPSFRAAIDRWWPALSPASLLRSLLGSRRSLLELGQGLFDRTELEALVRSPAKKISEERWTRGDLGLLDELQDRVSGDIPSFGHVVVDEAQDLSSMELRMVARRTPERSITVLGDLAQSTTIVGQTDWTSVLAELGHRRGDALGRNALTAPGRVCELTLGYRVPERIVDIANRLLPVAAPGVVAARSVRPGGMCVMDRVSVYDRAASAARAAVLGAADDAVVGLLGPASQIDELLDAVRLQVEVTEGTVAVNDARRGLGIEPGINVCAAEASKGLEFDVVVVVEPAAIVSEHLAGPQVGYRTLFVALTRATQEVRVVHALELPDELGLALVDA